MARKDKILSSFLKHKKIKDEYQISGTKTPKTVKDALKSEELIVETIAMIVQKLEGSDSVRDIDVYSMVTNYLNLNAKK